MNNSDKIIKKSRERIQIFFEDPSLTEQTHKNDCNINTIIKKYTKTGILPTNSMSDPQYGFAPNIDFKTALDLVKNTHREFDDLDPQEKALFNNNATKYAQFLTEYEEPPLTFEDESPAKPDPSVQEPTKDASESSSDAKE